MLPVPAGYIGFSIAENLVLWQGLSLDLLPAQGQHFGNIAYGVAKQNYQQQYHLVSLVP